MTFKLLTKWVFLLVVGVTGLHCGEAVAQRPGTIRVMGVTTPPSGWVQFCRDHQAYCHAKTGSLRAAVLDGRRWNELVQINLAVNRDIEQVTDDEHHGVPEFWSFPDDGKGDCEDLVLEKQRRLIAVGWPRETLLVTVVRDLNGDGHAILTVKTDRGDYILDNHRDDIVLWHDTGYRFVKRQSQQEANVWVALDGHNRAEPQIATMARPSQN